LWTGDAFDPGDHHSALVFYNSFIVSGWDFTWVGTGIARVEKNSTIATRERGFLFDANDDPVMMFGGALVVKERFDDTYVYVYGYGAPGRVIGRVPRARVTERAAYTFWDGASWVSDVAASLQCYPEMSAAPACPDFWGTVGYNSYLRQISQRGHGSEPGLYSTRSRHLPDGAAP
jgi:hypothetical protein